MTADEALRKYVSVLRQQGVDEAEEGVKALLCHVLKLNSSQLFADPDRVLTEDEASTLEDLITQRINKVPVAYLVRSRGFYGLDLYVDPRVLVPRPETEILVEEAINLVRGWQSRSDRALRLADVGTGSGAIAVALAANTEDALVYAVDILRDALDVAEINIKRHKLEGRIVAVHGNLLQQINGKLDMVLANLPYVEEETLAKLPEDISKWEPRAALNGGEGGVTVIGELIRQCADKVVPGGYVLLEIGAGQEEPVRQEIAAALTGADVALIKDLAGINRVMKIRISEF